jgi:5'-3' exonuclease
MGVRGLFSYIKHRVDFLDPLQTDPQTIGVDLYGLLYIWQDDLESIRAFREAFTRAGHSLIFVFDGEAPAEKKEIVAKRKENRFNASLQLRALETFLQSDEGQALDAKSKHHLEKQIKSLQSSSWHITKDYKQKVQKILETEGSHCIFPKGEADEELVNLERRKDITVILSSDMDFVRFGVNRIWVPHFRNQTYKVYDIDIPYFCEEEGITIEGLSDVAKLCGSELEHLGTTPGEAFGLIRFYGNLENLQRFQPERCVKQKQTL